MSSDRSGSPAPCTSPYLARLCFWVPPARLSEFESLYASRLVPLLRRHGLVEARERSRPTLPGVFSRLFGVSSPNDSAARHEALYLDPTRVELQAELGRLMGTGSLLPGHWGFYRGPAGPGQAVAGGPGRAVAAGRGRRAKAGSGRRVKAGRGWQRGYWQTLGVADGLPGSAIVAICRDREGDLWLGSWNGGGVSRYDGGELVTFTSADGLAGDRVHAILEDRQANLWFGTEKGVSRYDGCEFLTYAKQDGLVPELPGPCYREADTVLSILEDRQGVLWFGTARGVTRYDGREFARFSVEEGLGQRVETSGPHALFYREVCSMLEDQQGRLWFGLYGGGVSRYDGQEFVTFTMADGLVGNMVASIAEDRQGNLWFGSWNGVSRYDGREFSSFTTADGLANDFVAVIRQGRQGDLWFGTRGGVSRYDGERFATYTVTDGLGDNVVSAIHEDAEGQLWFGTGAKFYGNAGGGVSRCDRVHVTHFTTADGLLSDHVTALLEDRQGRLWAGTWKGACWFDGMRFTPVEEPIEKLRYGCKARVILEDRRGALWFGMLDGYGVIRYDGDQVEHYYWEDDPAGGFVEAMLEDHDGSLWLGTWNGVKRFDGQRFERFASADELTHSRILSIAQDRRGNLWFGTRDRGVSRYNGHTFATFTTAEGLAHDQVQAILEDRQGCMWFGTAKGVSRFDGERFATLTTEQGLGHDQVTSILEDRQGRLWFSTFGGGASCYDGQIIQVLDRRSGLPHDGVLQVLQDRQGDFWFATDGGGVARYRPSHHPPGVRLTGVSADQAYGPVAELSLPEWQKLLVFAFQGRSWTTPAADMVYSYRLEGHEATWQTTRQEQVAYHGLARGRYTFTVRSVDRDLNYSEPAQVQVQVAPDPRLEAWADALSAGPAGAELVGHSPALRQVQQQLAQVAATDLTVLILGKTGTGKGLAARRIHQLSPRHTRPFIVVSCGAMPESLVESELFGHEKGAFTGAVTRRIGKVELARGGTLFLDEIGDLALESQAKLLRLLEEGTFERVGGNETLRAEARVVAATNRDLAAMVAAGAFRQDLYYRLQVYTVELPLLRQRREDIAELAAYFAARMAAHLHKKVCRFEPEALAALQRSDWPGNVRELEHAVRRGVVSCPGDVVRLEDLRLEAHPARPGPNRPTPEQYEHEYLAAVMEECGWVIKGSQGAAARLGVTPATVRNRLRKMGMSRPPTVPGSGAGSQG